MVAHFDFGANSGLWHAGGYSSADFHNIEYIYLPHTKRRVKKFVVSAFEKKMLGNTFLVLVLKEFLTYVGVLEQLPLFLAKLPIPSYLVFGIVFFLATVISASTAAIAMGAPLAFAAMPAGGAPLMVYLMCMVHAASQISPTHICLVVASDYYKNIFRRDDTKNSAGFNFVLCFNDAIYCLISNFGVLL